MYETAYSFCMLVSPYDLYIKVFIIGSSHSTQVPDSAMVLTWSALFRWAPVWRLFRGCALFRGCVLYDVTPAD